MCVVIIDHLEWALACYLEYLSIIWWLCTSHPFIDASATEENYEEEEGFYGEEDIENFDHLNNQGKLSWVQAFYLGNLIHPKFYFYFLY